ncbi:MAG: Clp protease ClpP [Lentisphaerae bacterium]|nr:Clp protease ClpP [Lentisphaerota bacterium]
MIRTKWYSLDVIEDVAELSIFDEIGGWGISVAEFKQQFDLAKSAKSVHLTINSPGGSVTDGMAIYNILKTVSDKLDVEIIGIAASMASVVALAGRSLTMDEGTYLMIHNPWTITWGDADRLRHDAAVLDKMANQIVGIYVAHSNKTEEEIRVLMAAETWFTEQEAIDAGFASEIKDSVKAAALYDVSGIGFRNAPRAALTLRAKFESVKSIRDFEEFLRDAGASRQEAAALASGGWKTAHRDDEQSNTEAKSELVTVLSELRKIWM